MSLYDKSELGGLAQKYGFIRDNLEKVIGLYDVLKYFNHNPLLQKSLALKGGTAINLTIFNLPRLSVDIDLDFTKKCSREQMLIYRELLNKEILNHMHTQGYILNSKSRNPHSLDSWAFYYQNAGGNKDNLKIEINYSMRQHVLPLVNSNTSVAFLPSFKIRALSPLELFGSKIKALIERTAARDLYDVHNMIVADIFDQQEMITLRKIVLFYLAVGGSSSPKVKFDFNSIDKLDFSEIRAHLLPVLRKKDKFDFETAKSDVKNFLLTLLQFTDDEKKFIADFNTGIYSPELLFEDKKNINSIASHPMAIWKTREK